MPLIVLWIALMAWMLAAEPRHPQVSIKVQEHGRVVTCSVPRHADNRELHIGIGDQSISSRQLDGDRAPITHRLELRRLPMCPSEEEHHIVAYCVVVTSRHESVAASSNMPCSHSIFH